MGECINREMKPDGIDLDDTPASDADLEDTPE